MNESILGIPGVDIFDATKFQDFRGDLQMGFVREQFKLHRYPYDVDTIAVSTSYPYVFKGLHLQIPDKRGVIGGKLVLLQKGRIWDVLLDVRKTSPMYGKYRGFLWDSSDQKQVFIPHGVAHGFLCLEESSTLIYAFIGDYKYEWEKSINWADPAIGLQLPAMPMMISAKDHTGMLLKDVDVGM